MKLLKNKNFRIIFILAILTGITLALKLLTPKEPLPTQPEIITSTPSPIPTTITLPGRGDPNFRLSLEPTIKTNYPLFDYVPFETENWSVDYLKPLEIQVMLKSDTPEMRQEVLDWIESKGVNPQTHKIIFKKKR